MIKATGQRECSHLPAEDPTPPLFSWHPRDPVTLLLEPPFCHKPHQACPRLGPSGRRQSGWQIQPLQGPSAGGRGNAQIVHRFQMVRGHSFTVGKEHVESPKVGGIVREGGARPLRQRGLLPDTCPKPEASRPWRVHLTPATAHTPSFHGSSEAACGATAVLAQNSRREGSQSDAHLLLLPANRRF